ncbi:hypothetical protein E1162_07450 [Rhodobacteraceae bacterium RKSG542]|uniref:hypothetical protein n=1 Tax=Pseudovibrio flavus TaxID=2529854 RepID=UPI0012BCBAE2|nr:hypothetical protein [Pseudovibrio flavus]MTI17073.1 hypothetical protein [Pseudovibrio flavus]
MDELEYTHLVRGRRQDSESHRRSNLLLSATEDFVARKEADQIAVQMYLELAKAYLPHTRVEARQRIAALLVDCPFCPTELTELLGRDNEQIIALTILCKAQGLSDAYLCAVLENGPEYRRVAVAKRASLSQKTIAALAQFSGPQTIAAFEEQHGPINDHLAKETSMTSKLEDLEEFLSEVEATEAEKPAQAPSALDAFLNADAVGRAALIVSADAQSLQKLIFSPHGSIPTSSISLVEQKQIVQQALKNGREPLIAALTKHSNLDAEACNKIIDDRNGYALAVLLRSLGMSFDYYSWLLIRFHGEALGVDRLKARITFFKSLSHQTAALIIEDWQSAEKVEQKTATTARHAPVYMEANGVRSTGMPRQLASNRTARTTAATRRRLVS